MTSKCVGCPSHEIYEVTFSLLIQGLIIKHKCKVDGERLFPQSKPKSECFKVAREVAVET